MNTSSTNHGAFLTRATLGSILLAHGALKIIVFTVPGTAKFFESLGLPAIVAYLTIFGEVIGGGGWEFPALLTVLAIVVAIQGAGSFALKQMPDVDSLIPAPLKA